MSEKNNNSLNSSDNKNNLLNNDSQERFYSCWRIIINLFLALILVTFFFLMWTSYTSIWRIFFILSIWSFWSNLFYIISVGIVDICLYKGYKKVIRFNNFLRNDYIRISLPFSISTVVIYWELALLGEKFQDIGDSVLDVCKSFFMHGLVLIIVLFDTFASYHVNKNYNYKCDILVISILMIIHFCIVIICKELLSIYVWDFLIMADFRQIISSFIIMYLITINGYLILYMISDNFFGKEKINEKREEIKIFNSENDLINDNNNDLKNILKSKNNNIKRENSKEIEIEEDEKNKNNQIEEKLPEKSKTEVNEKNKGVNINKINKKKLHVVIPKA